ncbi:MAG: O-antigen ligase family protein, partial [Spirochaetes bacterium]|nr:O-antigen ligase family protein [Spirochaetota bacterium]
MSKKKISANNDKASNFFNFIISLLPFILLILIGIIQGEITLHQKVFKTFLIFLFDSLLLITIFLYMFIKKDMTIIKRKYLLFFLLYLSYVFIQYIISFLSKEISYDRDYHLGNYILLIIFGFFFFLYIRNFLQIETGLLIINFFMLIVFIWSLYELIIKGFNFGNFRPELSFGNTDYFAGYIIGLLPLSLIGALIWFINYNETKKPFQLFLAISCLILSLIGIAPLIATQTKSAIFGWYIGYMLIFISCLILIQKKFVLRTKLIFSSVYLMIFIIIPIIFLLFPPPFIKLIFRRIFDAFNDFDFFLKDRIENGWAGALGLFKDHPLFGAGLGSVYPASFKYIGKFFYLYSSSNSFKHSHCEYVEILGEAGIFGIMIFSSLILFVIISLFKITFSDKYHIKFRLLSLGTCCGIISMLIHQIFSLSLRMSVTMTAFFFLMGLSIFIISYKNKALVDSIEEEKSVQNDHGNHKFFIPYFEKNITLRNFYIILIIILMLVFYSFILIMPVFNSENNIIKSEKSYIMAGNIYDQALQDEKNISNYASLFNKYIELSNKYIKNAIIIKPDNPYAWTQKYILDRDVNFKLTKDDDDVKAVLNDIKTDLDNLNS